MSDHDMRYDLASELWLVAELLEAEGQDVDAFNCRQAATAVEAGELSINRGIKVLCHHENLIGV